jgi:hypothetical protein
MNMTDGKLPYRQVHLDFHTSELIDGIGEDFDPGQFAAGLERAKVNSITCFARCHHGWVYYDSKKYPQRMHPHLKRRDLLREQIEACHARGIRAPIYITVQWDLVTAKERPEWLCRHPDGRVITFRDSDPGFYLFLCVNTGYGRWLEEFTGEVLATLPTDGLFFDIVKPMACCCEQCRAGMKQAGLNPEIEADRMAYGHRVIAEFERRMTEFVRARNADCTIFYNSGHIGPAHRNRAGAYSHFEIESVPSGKWGYWHYPLAVRYARGLGKACLGMTGRFHTSWGDFHSFKNVPALEFECFRSLAFNNGCSVGDQLHPRGRLCAATYELIGSVYSQVEPKEPWCEGARAVTDIGVLTPEEYDTGSSSYQPGSIAGATRLLQEAGHQFDIIDSKSDLSGYRLLVLPDEYRLTDAAAGRVRDYLAGGGAALASYHSGLDMSGKAFAMEEMGVEWVGEAPYSLDFIYALPGGSLGNGMAATEHVMYLRGGQVRAESGSETLAEVRVPYFNRTKEQFCSHRHTPSSGRVGYPGAVRRGRVIYFAHPMFTQYYQFAPRWCKKLVCNAINLLMPQRAVASNAPSTALITLNEQPYKNRLVLHVLHYIPERRGVELDVIEDIIDLHDIMMSVRAEKKVSAVNAVPQGEKLTFSQQAGRIEFTIPRVHGHQMVEIQFE